MVSKVLTHSRFSFKVRMKRSATPLPSGCRTKEGEASIPRHSISSWKSPGRLGAEDEGVIGDAIAVDLRVDGELADAGEALAWVAVDAAVEQVRGDQVLRILEPPPQRGNAAAVAVGVLRRP